MRRLQHSNSSSPSDLRRLTTSAAGPLSSGSLRVSHCFSAPLSPSQVSAPCTPQLRTPAQLPPAHPRAKIRSALILSCKRSRAPLLSPFHRSRSPRDFFEVKSLTAWHKRIEPYYNYLTKLGGSRGRRGARAASVDAALTHSRVWSGLGSARSRLARRLGGRVFRRCCGPALSGRWRGRLASGLGHRLAAAPARAIAVGRLAACAWRAARVGSGEPCAHSLGAFLERVSGGLLSVSHVGGV